MLIDAYFVLDGEYVAVAEPADSRCRESRGNIEIFNGHVVFSKAAKRDDNALDQPRYGTASQRGIA
ncbi:hypothetical protein [Sphingomonas faeni]|uniref:hypothetical protein n=1 Tax=Sphingomonas faeni TaxID=185950 RepID=UPI0020C7AE50|nr:hypothetical protein [Sphingomonas faeni]MCP8891736.1 hypothetical protein [Sphingomonas faeni]